MPIKYKPVKVSDNINRAAVPRYMPRCTDCVPITLCEIAQRISDSSSFTTTDVVGMMGRVVPRHPRLPVERPLRTSGRFRDFHHLVVGREQGQARTSEPVLHSGSQGKFQAGEGI